MFGTLTLNITVPQELYFFIFFGAISCYNFVKYGVEAEKYILVANTYQKIIQFFSFGCLLVAGYQLFFLTERVFVGLLVLAAITGLYALVPFEIRDLKYDSASLKTLPQRVGVKGAKRIGYCWTVLFYAITFLKTDLDITHIMVKTILFVVLMLMIFKTELNQKKYFSSFWVEAIPLLWWVLFVISIKYSILH